MSPYFPISGARLETHTDDASQVQQQAQQYAQSIAYSNRAENADLGGQKGNISEAIQKGQLVDSFEKQGLSQKAANTAANNLMRGPQGNEKK